MKTEKLGDHLMVVYGPPGTGKTTRMLELLETELAHIAPDQIAFTSFTRAARKEAADRAVTRFNLSPEQLRWFRTLHSIGYCMLGMRRDQMLTKSKFREFCEQFSYDLTDDKTDEDDAQVHRPPQRTRDDDLRAVHEWGMQRCRTLREAWTECPTRVELELLEIYVQRLEAFKAEHGLIDYHDMLVKGMDAGIPPVSVAFIDEAQDLTPLQIKACYEWFADCRRVYVAGDDDQAIYLWSGADPQWLMDLKGVATHHEFLEKSYRVPEHVHAVASRIIHRNRRRVEKPYRSAKPGGVVLTTTRRKALERTYERTNPEWTTFILVRNRFLAEKWTRELMRQGIPYYSEIGSRGPLAKFRLVKAVLAANKLLRGQDIEGDDLRAIMDHVPARGKITLPRGTKARSKGFKGRVTRMQLILEWQLNDMVKRLEELGPARGLFKESQQVLDYLELVLRRFGTLPRYPNTRILTIHAAKGREANTIIIDTDMAKASWREWQRDPEGENRVAYVAVTRAKDELLICDPETPRHYPYWEFVEMPEKVAVPF